MTGHVARGSLQVASVFADFVETRLLPGLSISAQAFWSGYESLLRDLVPENRRLLTARADLQRQIDTWLEERRGKAWDNDAWISFLREVGYLVPEGPAFEVATETVDPEISTVAGPQLVVPVSNARFALNAANARWGSLYDALYGTDALPGKPQGGGYDA